MGRADICGEFSFHLPIHVLAEFFMISEEDALRIRNIGHAFNLALQTKDFDAIQKHSLVLYDIAQGIIDDRKENPRDPGADPASALLAARDFDGEPLPDQGIWAPPGSCWWWASSPPRPSSARPPCISAATSNTSRR